jgi:tetrachlorobenzoquinone reductase
MRAEPPTAMKILKSASSAAIPAPEGSPVNLIEVRLVGVRFGARDTNLFEFQRLNGESLPSIDAGAHIDVHLPNGIVRQYSLIRADHNPRAYVIGVKRDAQSRGGSIFMHDQLRVGMTLSIGKPRNNFPLVEDAEHTVLIAGGIGITPIWSMWQRLKLLGRSVQLVYACRSRADAVFIDQLQSDDLVTLRFDDENHQGVLDFAAVLAGVPKHSHLFCCGPLTMLKAFESATAGWPAEQVHVEYFTPPAAAASEGGFIVELARSGKQFRVEPGQTVLAAVIAAGVDAPYSCEEGVCGACMTTVVSGVPDHRDTVLTQTERNSNKTIMICCSGSKTDRLVLDL